MSDTDQTTAATTPPADDASGETPHTPNELEVTTAKDGNLLVNQPAVDPTVATQATSATPNSTLSDTPVPITTSTPDSGQPTEGKTDLITPPSATPIVVSENEVDASANTNQVADEIEVLSGEIQALEAKIDRLATNVSVDTSKNPATKTEEAKNIDITSPQVDKPSEPKENDNPVKDLYSSKDSKDEVTAETEETAVVGDGGGTSVSAIGTIGEVLMIFGLIIFFLMAASPFAKDLVGDNIWDAIRTIGWPTTGLSLIIGFLLSLFAKGKGLLKLLAIVLLLISVMMYLSISGKGSYLGPIQSFLEPLFSFYN